MKSGLKLIAILITLVLFVSCSTKDGGTSTLLKEKITADNISELAKKMKDDKDITREEIDLFSGGLIRLSTLSKDTLYDKTVGEIIESQRKAVMDNSLTQLENAAIRTQLSISQAFQFVQLIHSDNDSMKTNIIKFKLQNKSKKNIKNLHGLLSVINGQNQIVKKFPIKIMMTLDAGKTYEMQTPAYIYNPNDQSDVLIREHPEALRPVWQCAYIEFADGKTLGNPLPN